MISGLPYLAAAKEQTLASAIRFDPETAKLRGEIKGESISICSLESIT